jgi:hypothetical protein
LHLKRHSWFQFFRFGASLAKSAGLSEGSKLADGYFYFVSDENRVGHSILYGRLGGLHYDVWRVSND